MTWYCIKHIPSGKIIPCAYGRLERGGSWVEPCSPVETPPRIFNAKRYAKGWLTTWLKGAVEMDRHTDSYTGEYDERTYIVPKPHRKREEYKIVPISFRIGK